MQGRWQPDGQFPVALRKESVDRNLVLVLLLASSPLWSLSARRAWIEISFCRYSACCVVSLSARRAWIEISSAKQTAYFFLVALRKESVDRNNGHETTPNIIWVALRKESVDRNCELPSNAGKFLMSLSARRAWIEIRARIQYCPQPFVALRKESVDRNC